MNKNLLLLPLLLRLATCFAQGPNEGFVLESEGTRHLLLHGDPIYPTIAKAAHVQGSVLLHVDVDATGTVTKVEVVGGPPMLRGAAVEAVKHWTYKPFEVDGKPAAVHAVVSIPFSLGIPAAMEKSDQAIGQAYFPKADQCRSANASGRWADGVKLCGELVSIASRFPDPKQRANEIRGAYEEDGEALAFSGDHESGLALFKQAVAVAEKSLTPKDAEYATAFYWQAFGEHTLRMFVEAERDYRTAETSYRNAMVNLPDMQKVYARYLAHTLAYHSVLETQTGHAEEAAKMQAEAISLDPHSMDGMQGARR